MSESPWKLGSIGRMADREHAKVGAGAPSIDRHFPALRPDLPSSGTA